MKKLTLAIIWSVLLLIGCNTQPYVVSQNQPYDYIQSPTGQQMVVVHDNGMDYMLEYAMFCSLMNSGGFYSVTNYYHSYPSRCMSYNRNTYNSWHSFNGTRYNSNKYSGYSRSSNGSGFRNTTPNTGSGFKNTSPSYNNTPKTTFKNTTPNSGGYGSGFKSTTPSNSIRATSGGGSFRSTGSSFRSSSSSSSRSGSGFRRSH